ncbi:MAG: hypothetical protein DRI95_14485 [Bacteroidetes bacterium]|nr:MAG: hypothetical protein DRI95_14485 [Bacteroidota bacterium]RLD74890.1 MAG: hypothetical protein DRJ07_19080 [Bacteroidota bacterium]
MAIGFPPTYELIVSSEISKEEFSQKSLMAFEKLKWKLVIGTPGFLKVNTKINFSTSGETFSVNYEDMKNIRLKSKSRFLNIVDWGMNRSNVRVFWSYFSRNI